MFLRFQASMIDLLQHDQQRVYYTRAWLLTLSNQFAKIHLPHIITLYYVAMYVFALLKEQIFNDKRLIISGTQ